ncbi:MAG: site-2 protease family protein [bacterium]|nr:site-2 protease family protein [bacterium]
MLDSGQNGLFAGAIQFLVLLLAISIHESAHAITALRAGDSTGAELGRISFNPLRHIDVLGSIVVPVVLIFAGGPVFGWAKPTPVRVGSLRHPDRDHLRVVLAGPLSNLLVGMAALVSLSAVISVLGPDGARTAGLCLVGDIDGAAQGANFPILYTMVQFAFLNGFLGVFNMIPVPPFDGGQVTLHLLPRAWASKYSVIRPYGFMIVLALAALNVLSVMVLPVYLIIALVIQISG